jgi:hypothetical protein
MGYMKTYMHIQQKSMLFIAVKNVSERSCREGWNTHFGMVRTNERERTRQNSYAMHTFPNLFIPIKCMQCATHN